GTPDGGIVDAGVPDAGGGALSCSDLFDEGTLQQFSFDISDDQWAALESEFNDLTDLMAGIDFATYHPITLHFGAETVTDAEVKLHGQSSWLQTVELDGAKAKMQFDVSFDQIDPNGAFHGVHKLIFDMPRSDWTFLHDRLAQHWLRQAGVLAPCSNSARLDINGAYYGLYALEEDVGGHLIQEFFPQDPDGDLWKGGEQAKTNEQMPNEARLKQFEAAADLTSLAAIVDIQDSLTSWAAEALINDADGYYNGSHNFYLYDQGAAGYVFLPQDTDSSFDWLVLNSDVGSADHPIYFWYARDYPPPLPGDKWMIVFNDAGWRMSYADAIAALLAKWDVTQIQGWIDAWSQQIAAAAAGDPHAWADAAETQMATAAARGVVADRAAYLQTFVDCEHGVAPAAADSDGDGYKWCDECDDTRADVHPGAPEICGNHLDDNCNGQIDEGCPPDAGTVGP
ncbi:MAG TPA: CotH kinase family protein, partial [Polyangia bacterium]